MPIYGCFDRPRPVQGTPLEVQDGYYQTTGIRSDCMVTVPFVMTEPCQYTKMHASDKLCAGCIHQHKEAV